MLYLLLFLSLLFLIYNLFITNFDYFHPASLFSEIFTFFIVICIFNQETYAISIIPDTVIVIVSAFITFSFFTTIFSYFKKNSIEHLDSDYKIVPINVNKTFVYGLILIQIVTIYYFIQYLGAISIAWYGYKGSLGEMILLFNTMTKFWKVTFQNLHVPIPIIFRLLNPISEAGGWLLVYVLTHNYIATKKVDFSQFFSVLLLVILIILNGSRSPLFRMITMVLIIYYILVYKQLKLRRLNIKFISSLLVVAVIVVFGFVGLLQLIGRNDTISFSRYFFIYTGAPIVNLNTFIENYDFRIPSNYFGEHVFKGLYIYISKIFHLDISLATEINNGFIKSANGIEIGNVYTTFYSIVYDFGIFGVIPIMSIISSFYVTTYMLLTSSRSPIKFDYKLFMYGYLFNDLFMSAFSNRFFETVLDAPFLKILLISFIFSKLFVRVHDR